MARNGEDQGRLYATDECGLAMSFADHPVPSRSLVATAAAGGGRRLEHAASSPLCSGSVDPAQGRRADLMARLASAAPREAPAGACFHKSFMPDPAPAGHSHPKAARSLCAGAKQH